MAWPGDYEEPGTITVGEERKGGQMPVHPGSSPVFPAAGAATGDTSPVEEDDSKVFVDRLRPLRLIVPWCTAALDLLVRGVSDFQSIDRTWMITLQSGMGPCGMMDRMGLGVVYHVAKLIGETTPNTQALEYASYVNEHFIQKGRLGVATGQGFYSYPNPAFAQPGFI